MLRTHFYLALHFLLIWGGNGQNYGGYPPSTAGPSLPFVGDYPYYRPTYPPQCALPNYISGLYVRIQPEQFLGRWFFYRNSNLFGAHTANGVLDYEFISNDHNIILNIPAVTQRVTVKWRDSPADDSICKFVVWFGKVMANGLFDGYQWDNGPTPPVQGIYQTLYFDPNNIYIKYSCASIDSVSGICKAPQFQINTRTPWNKLDHEVLNSFDRIIDTVLAPFCRRAADFPKHFQSVALPNCTEPEPMVQPFRSSWS